MELGEPGEPEDSMMGEGLNLSAGMRPESDGVGDGSVADWLFRWRHGFGVESIQAEQPEHRFGRHGGKELVCGIGPPIFHGTGNVGRGRCTQCNQHVLIE